MDTAISLTNVYTEVMLLAVRGYTVRTIKKKLLPKFPTIKTVPDALLTRWILESAGDLHEARELEDKYIEEHVGLVRKYQRLLRLVEQAEALEDKATTSPQWAGEFRRTIAEIDRLCVGTTITFDISDGWAKLLRDIAGIGPSTFVEQSALGTTEEDNSIIIDLAHTDAIPDSPERQAAKADLWRGT